MVAPGSASTWTAAGSGTSYDSRPLATPAVAAAVVGAGSALLWSYGPLVATGAGPVDEGSVGFLWIALGLGGLLGPLTGRLVERRGLAGAWAWSVARWPFASVALAGAVGLGLAWPAYVAMACFGAGYMCLSGVLILWAREVWPEAAGRGTSVLFVALAVGQAVGAVTFDALARRRRCRHRLPDRRPPLPRGRSAGQASLTSISTLPTAPSSTACVGLGGPLERVAVQRQAAARRRPVARRRRPRP